MSDETEYQRRVREGAARERAEGREKSKDGSTTYNDYLELVGNPALEAVTEQARSILEEAMPAFLDLVRERVQIEADFRKARGLPEEFESPQQRLYINAAFYFFKWLNQMPSFDEVADPSWPVPIVVAWQNRKGQTGLIHNFIGSRTENLVNVVRILNPFLTMVKEHFEREEKAARKSVRREAEKGGRV